MKVVLLHDWLTGFRGGERVLEVFCEMFPDAPVYTLIHIPGSTSPIIENGNRKIQTSFLNKIPGIKKHYRKFLPFFPFAVKFLKIKENNVDLIISSSHCVIKGVLKRKRSDGKEVNHISYIHSPMRYIYDQFDTYFGKGTPLLQRIGATIFRKYLQKWDRESNKNVDLMVANSSFVQNRISKYYQCDSKVIHPFVDLKDFISVQENPPPKENYYLVVSAFAPNKRIDLAVETFNKLKLPLKIVGSGQQENELKNLAGKSIEFMGNLEREEIVSLMAKAKGFIFPGVEDFGITPLESLASGTPVVAFKRGGVLETLNENVACFFEDQTVESLSNAVRTCEKMNFSLKKLHERANEFSREKFIEKISSLLGAVDVS